MTEIQNIKHDQALSLLIGHIPLIPSSLTYQIDRETRETAGGGGLEFRSL